MYDDLLAEKRALEREIEALKRDLERLSNMLDAQAKLGGQSKSSSVYQVPDEDVAALKARIRELEEKLRNLRDPSKLFLTSITTKDREAGGDQSAAIERLKAEIGRLSDELRALRILLQRESELAAQAEKNYERARAELAAQRLIDKDNAEWWKRVADVRKEAIRKLEIHLSYAQQEATVERLRADKAVTLGGTKALLDSAGVVMSDDASVSGLTDVSELAGGFNSLDMLIMDGRLDKKALSVLSRRAASAVEVATLQTLLSIDLLDFGATVTQIATGLVPQYRSLVSFPVRDLESFTLGTLCTEPARISLIAIVNNQHLTLASGTLNLSRLLVIESRDHGHSTRTIAGRVGLFATDGHGEILQDSDLSEPIVWIDVKVRFRYSIHNEVIIAQKENDNVRLLLTDDDATQGIHNQSMNTMNNINNTMMLKDKGATTLRMLNDNNSFASQTMHGGAFSTQRIHNATSISPINNNRRPNTTNFMEQASHTVERTYIHNQRSPANLIGVEMSTSPTNRFNLTTTSNNNIKFSTNDGYVTSPPSTALVREEFMNASQSLYSAKLNVTHNSLQGLTSAFCVPDETDIDSRLLSGKYRLHFSIIQARDLNLAIGIPNALNPRAQSLKPYVVFNMLGSEASTPLCTKAATGPNPMFGDSWNVSIPLHSPNFREWACNGGFKLLVFTDDEEHTLDLASTAGGKAIAAAQEYIARHLKHGQIGQVAPNGLVGFATISLHGIFLDASQELRAFFPLREGQEGKATGASLLVHAKWTRMPVGTDTNDRSTMKAEFSDTVINPRFETMGGFGREDKEKGNNNTISSQSVSNFSSGASRLPPECGDVLLSRYTISVSHLYHPSHNAMEALEHLFLLHASQSTGGDLLGGSTAALHAAMLNSNNRNNNNSATTSSGIATSSKSITFEDFIAMSRAIPGLDLLRNEAELLFQHIDGNQNGSLGFSELQNALISGDNLIPTVQQTVQQFWDIAKSKYNQYRSNNPNKDVPAFVNEILLLNPNSSRSKLVLSQSEFSRLSDKGFGIDWKTASKTWCSIGSKVSPGTLGHPDGGISLMTLSEYLDPSKKSASSYSGSLSPNRRASNGNLGLKSGFETSSEKLSGSQSIDNVIMQLANVCKALAKLGKKLSVVTEEIFVGKPQISSLEFREGLSHCGVGMSYEDYDSIFDMLSAGSRYLTRKSFHSGMLDAVVATGAAAKTKAQNANPEVIQSVAKGVQSRNRSLHLIEIVAFQLYKASKLSNSPFTKWINNQAQITEPVPACAFNHLANFIESVTGPLTHSTRQALMSFVLYTPSNIVDLAQTAELLYKLADDFEERRKDCERQGYDITQKPMVLPSRPPPEPTRFEADILREKLAEFLLSRSKDILEVVMSMDTNRDGLLEREEWFNVFIQVGAGLSLQEIDKLFFLLAIKPDTTYFSGTKTNGGGYNSSMRTEHIPYSVHFASLRYVLAPYIQRVDPDLSAKRRSNPELRSTKSILLERLKPICTAVVNQAKNGDVYKLIHDTYRPTNDSCKSDLVRAFFRKCSSEIPVEQEDLDRFVAICDKDWVGLLEISDLAGNIAASAVSENLLDEDAMNAFGSLNSSSKILPGNNPEFEQYAFSQEDRIAITFRLHDTLKSTNLNKLVAPALSYPDGDFDRQSLYDTMLAYIYPGGIDPLDCTPHLTGKAASILPLELWKILSLPNIQGNRSSCVDFKRFEAHLLTCSADIELIRRNALRIVKRLDIEVKKKFDADLLIAQKEISQKRVYQTIAGSKNHQELSNDDKVKLVGFAPTVEGWFEKCERDAIAKSGGKGRYSSFVPSRLILEGRAEATDMFDWASKVDVGVVRRDFDFIFALGSRDALLTVDYDDLISAIRTSVKGSPLSYDLSTNNRLMTACKKFTEFVLAESEGDLQIFLNRWDTDNSNSLSKQELRLAIKRGTITNGKGVLTDDELDSLFGFFDMDGSGTITKQEFRRKFEEIRTSLMSQAEQTNAAYTVRSQNLLDQPELAKLLVKFTQFVTEFGSLQKFVESVDVSADAQISKEELYRAICSKPNSNGSALFTMEEMSRIFEFFDIDRSLNVSKVELVAGLQKLSELIKSHPHLVQNEPSSAVNNRTATSNPVIKPKLTRAVVEVVEKVMPWLINHPCGGPWEFFKLVDTSKDGTISVRELYTALTNGVGDFPYYQKIELTEMEIRRLFNYMDIDKSGLIDKQEFTSSLKEALTASKDYNNKIVSHAPVLKESIVLSMNYLLEGTENMQLQERLNVLRRRFNILDNSGDGELSKKELWIEFCRKSPPILTRDQFDEMFDYLDMDGNGTVTFTELATQLVEAQKKLDSISSSNQATPSITLNKKSEPLSSPVSSKINNDSPMNEDQSEALLTFAKWLRFMADRHAEGSLEKFFMTADKDKSGDISLDELYNWMETFSSARTANSKTPRKPTRSEIRVVFKLVDIDGDKALEFNELHTRIKELVTQRQAEAEAASKKESAPDENTKNAALAKFITWFAQTRSDHGGTIDSFVLKVDKNRDGELNFGEIADYVLKCDPHASRPSRQELRIAFAAIDIDGTMTIDPEEIKLAIKNQLAMVESKSKGNDSTSKVIENTATLQSNNRAYGESFITWLSSLAQRSSSPQTFVDEFVKAVDLDQSGSLSAKEFVRYLSSRSDCPLQDREAHIAAFKYLDIDNSGSVTSSELKQRIKDLISKYMHNNNDLNKENNNSRRPSVPNAALQLVELPKGFNRNRLESTILSILKHFAEIGLAPSQISRMADIDKNGVIDQREFIQFLSKRIESVTIDDLVEVFHAFDSDDSHTLDTIELDARLESFLKKFRREGRLSMDSKSISYNGNRRSADKVVSLFSKISQKQNISVFEVIMHMCNQASSVSVDYLANQISGLSQSSIPKDEANRAIGYFIPLTNSGVLETRAFISSVLQRVRSLQRSNVIRSAKNDYIKQNTRRNSSVKFSVPLPNRNPAVRKFSNFIVNELNSSPLQFYKMADAKGNRQLTYFELKSFIERMKGRQSSLTLEDIDRAFRCIDVDNNEIIDISEFLSVFNPNASSESFGYIEPEDDISEAESEVYSSLGQNNSYHGHSVEENIPTASNGAYTTASDLNDMYNNQMNNNNRTNQGSYVNNFNHTQQPLIPSTYGRHQSQYSERGNYNLPPQSNSMSNFNSGNIDNGSRRDRGRDFNNGFSSNGENGYGIGAGRPASSPMEYNNGAISNGGTGYDRSGYHNNQMNQTVGRRPSVGFADTANVLGMNSFDQTSQNRARFGSYNDPMTPSSGIPTTNSYGFRSNNVNNTMNNTMNNNMNNNYNSYERSNNQNRFENGYDGFSRMKGFGNNF